MTPPFTSTMNCWTYGDDSDNPLQHSWWYAPLDWSGPAPASAGSATRINNINAWMAGYNATSATFVEKWLYCPNGSNDIPLYYSEPTDPLVDWDLSSASFYLHTPSAMPPPGSTGAGTRNGKMILYDWHATAPIVMQTGPDGWMSEYFRLDTKGIQGGRFDGHPDNDGPRGRSGWAKQLMMQEYLDHGGWNHRIGMGWPIADKVDLDNVAAEGFGPDAMRTKDFCWPMTGNDKGPMFAVEGQVFRIKASVNLEAFTWVDDIAHEVAKTMQVYGAVVVDGEGDYTGGPIIDQYTSGGVGIKSQEVVNNVPITPANWEFVQKGYDPRDDVSRR